MRISKEEHFVCAECLNGKFEEAFKTQKKSTSGTILPEGIILQHALWNFDKGGYLQELLHQLKYHRLTGVGIDIGRQLGKSLLQNTHFMEAINNNKVRLLPVPLHPNKRRMRGYNQAFFIAKGVAEVTQLPISKRGIVVRNRNTNTQTGFSMEKRRKNMEGAFSVAKPEKIKDSICVIIDDVFTTGATTFELSNELKKTGCTNIMIATVAQA
ncbi:MAG: ComF family protein [Gracilimonas sp.]|nr:ComF family protein [Gracilimonas sp.]